jgi:hypothetical protein
MSFQRLFQIQSLFKREKIMKQFKNLPSPMGLSKAEILEILQREEYGYMPNVPVTVSVEQTDIYDNFCAGKAHRVALKMTLKFENGEYSFPFVYTRPTAEVKHPLFIHINFRPDVPDRYEPSEEIVDEGFAVMSFHYNDVTLDENEDKSGLYGVLYPEGQCDQKKPGKLIIWAYAASRIMDYALTLPEIDHEKVSVCGHSRLGKTALVCGAFDERFYCAFSNDSGCSGASIAREKPATPEIEREHIKEIMSLRPFWFNTKYREYIDREDELPFDQHFLLAANIPHKVYVASAVGDTWACPENEYRACLAADEYYRVNGKNGFAAPRRLPCVGEHFHDGDIAYHIRAGNHYLSREDWSLYIKFLNS